MAEKLTPQQLQAVEDRGGKLLVSAAAGSGKTKVLVDRLMKYITDPHDPANIDEFLMITYTKAAAAELRGKIAAKLSERIADDPSNRHLQQQLQRLYLTKISTVHAFCGDILREYAYRLNLPGDFRVADENECAEIRIAVVNRILEDAYDHAGQNPDFCAFVDSQGLGRDDRQVPEIVLKVYDSARCHLDPNRWLEKCVALVDVETLEDASETVFGAFLIQRLHQWLDLQISAMDQCAVQAAASEGMEKPAALLADTVYQLQALRRCSTWDAIAAHPGVDFGTLRFGKACTDEALIQRIKAVREHCKKGLARELRPFADPSQQVLRDLQQCAAAARGMVQLVEQFGREYDKVKRSRRILDFGDLEHRMLDLLLGKSRGNLSAAAVEIGQRFREIMVDEYQDSNQVQDAIYGALSQKRQNLFMVGDVKQSIYQFRLADPGIFLEKYASYVPADEAQPGQGRKVMLSRNFRSSGGVLAAANDVFRLCMCPEVGGLYYGDEEALYEGIPHISLGAPETELLCIDVQEDTYAEEANVVARRIQKMLEDGECVRDGDALRPVKPEDIVILMRSPGSTGVHFQRALERAGIRCATGGGEDLLQTEEIAALRSLLQAIHNPRLDIPLVAAMASPIFGFTADELAQIRAGNTACSVYESLTQCPMEKVQDFLAVLQKLRHASRKHSLTGLLEQIFLLTGMDELYAAMDHGDLRSSHLQTFFTLAAQFESGGNGELGRFLEYLTNMEDKGLITTAEQSASDAVSIMSIHKSKGLEFPVVFLCCLSRSFNTESQRANVLCHKELGLGLSAVDTQKRIRYPSIAKRAIAAQFSAESISEDLRVLYVAMTRPKDRLIMTYASDRLDKDLTEMVDRMEIGGLRPLIREAVCPGEWVLLTALQRTEAGALFALGGYPQHTTLGNHPWKIQVVQAGEQVIGTADSTELVHTMPEGVVEQIRYGLACRYAYQAATVAPSKQTATQRKGRVKDQEIAEDTRPEPTPQRKWRKPGFAPEESRGKLYGTAVHAVMQYMDYRACCDEKSIAKELERLVEQCYILPEQAQMICPATLAAFFASPLGQKLRAGEVVREFKFSLLVDGGDYDPALEGEKILLQGVVDCALIEEDGITVLDYKTDYVTDETLDATVARYRPQVEAYAQAMEKIYCRKVKTSALYFFHLNRLVEL